MKLIKKMGLALGVAMAVVGVQPVFAAADDGMKVAVVNVQQVLQQSPRVAALSKKLEGDFKTRQTNIASKQKALQDKLEQFKKDSADSKMAQKDRDAAQKRIAADRSELVKEVVAYQQDLGKEQNKVMQSILSDLNGIVSNLAKKQGVTLVLDSQAVVFSDKTNDLTKVVAKEFNSKS